ncbi:ABC transporter permease DevC [Neoroseomonas oryzicola]|uniref:FtsX-like permease family protein n=1 Tax=Neoroseomonas oryzicola TaxID=535904 RepID=A0A9X9WBP4_9PROT|nr:ABC transporter permease DevC [Neoroseomonas oryzicola]MBR0657754.1 FtsX-like permease family protein [Neoroseomonas oryzicola]NKE17574.1 FtsX-like permease family protein [Neoroseomonas oryzicola]
MNVIAKPTLLPWAPEHTGESVAPPAAAPAARAGGPGLLAYVLLPARLAWRQLRAERARLFSAMAGVMFAAVLVFMQLGFRSALFDSATRLLAAMEAELFLMNPLTTASFRPEPLPRVRAHQALALPEVAQAVPVYLAQSTWRNPEDGSRRAIQMIGFDVEAGAMHFEGLDAIMPALRRVDAVGFDTRSRPEFGDVARLFAERGPFEVQVGNRMVEIAGLVSIGPSFGADGNLVMSEVNFRRMVRERQASNTDLVAIRLQPGADIAAAQARLREILPPDVVVLTHEQLVAHERYYWETATPIGFIFAFGSVMGLIVGMVIVYQILFSDIANHLREYATLKAIGYSNGYLARVVMAAALILAVIGFLPGAALCVWLYDVVAGATFLPLAMTLERAGMVFALIFGMCAAAGLLAMRKLRDASPADMF